MTYDDIINLPHYVSKKRPQMSMQDRAAQFSPFAALVGYDECIAETDRQVEQFAELDENYLQELDDKLQYIQERISERPLVEITYFVPDEVLNGGKYVTTRGHIKCIVKERGKICMMDKKEIDIHYIKNIVVE